MVVWCRHTHRHTQTPHREGEWGKPGIHIHRGEVSFHIKSTPTLSSVHLPVTQTASEQYGVMMHAAIMNLQPRKHRQTCNFYNSVSHNTMAINPEHVRDWLSLDHQQVTSCIATSYMLQCMHDIIELMCLIHVHSLDTATRSSLSTSTLLCTTCPPIPPFLHLSGYPRLFQPVPRSTRHM